MDEIWRKLAWILGSGGFGAVLGGSFGGVSGAVYWSSGRRAGTLLGQRVLAAFEKAGGHEYTPRTRGTIVGATDGFLFLGVVGTLLGFVFAYVARPDAAVLLVLASAGVLLALAAVFFGVLAYAIVRNGVWAVIGLFVGAMSGAFTAAMLFGGDHLLVGVVPGMTAGTLASFLLRKYEPQLCEPRVAKPAYDNWRCGSDEITAEPNEHDSDSIQKAQPSEE